MTNLQDVLDQITVAYEARDFDGFVKHLTSDFTWYAKDGSVVVSGAEAFLAEAKKYFNDNPTAVSKLSPAIILGNLATQTETVSGLKDGAVDEYLWVYEFEGDKISKQWGFLPTA